MENFNARYYGYTVPFNKVILNFYVLEEMTARLNAITGQLLPSQEKLIKDANALKDSYSKSIANAMFDYLAVSSYAEARYGTLKDVKAVTENGKVIQRTLKHHLNKISTSFDKMPRSLVVEQATHFNPKNFLPLLEFFFSKERWGADTMGGAKWGKVAKYAYKFFTQAPVIFIDNVVDLTHNGGIVWNKGFIFRDAHRTALIRLLTYKRKHSLLVYAVTPALYKEIKEIFNRADTLKMLKFKKNFEDTVAGLAAFMDDIYYQKEENLILPAPVKWGKKPLVKGMIIS